MAIACLKVRWKDELVCFADEKTSEPDWRWPLALLAEIVLDEIQMVAEQPLPCVKDLSHKRTGLFSKLKKNARKPQ